MKRDMELIRNILARVESGADGFYEFSGAEAYNAALLCDAGLVIGHLHRDDSVGLVGATIERLTWSGHEFLDATRDDTIWNKAKERIIKPGASWTFSILLEFLKAEAQRRLSSALGLPPVP